MPNLTPIQAGVLSWADAELHDIELPTYTELAELLRHAHARIQLANAEGNPILSAWAPAAAAVLAKLPATQASETPCDAQVAEPAEPQWPDYRDMTPQQRLAWAEAERGARIAELAMARGTPEGLKAAQLNAESRRKAVGMSQSMAASLVLEAGRLARRTASTGGTA